MHKIVSYTSTYAPWEDGQDEPTKIGEDTGETVCEPDEWEREDYPTAVEYAAHLLTDRYYVMRGSADNYSSSDWYAHGWYAPEPYENPYTGECTETTLHLDGFTDEEARAVYALMSTRA